MNFENINPSKKVISNLVLRRVDEEGNHVCITWRLENFSSISKENENFVSPLFTVGTAAECKWYLKFQPVYRGIIHTFYLILDPESDCKEACVKLQFHFLDGNNVSICTRNRRSHSCRNELQAGRTCKFITKSDSERKVGTAFKFNQFPAEDTLIVKCEIKIQSVVPEVNNLSSDLESLLENQSFTDVVISIAGKKYPAIKAILAARSPVFAAMFTHNMVEKEGTVRIEDIGENVFEEMLRYVYTGKLTLESRQFAKELLAAAHKYDMKDLLDRCEKMLIENLSCSSALDVLALAKLLDREELKSKIIGFILRNQVDVRNTAAWKNLPKQDPDLLQEICEASLDFKH